MKSIDARAWRWRGNYYLSFRGVTLAFRPRPCAVSLAWMARRGGKWVIQGINLGF